MIEQVRDLILLTSRMDPVILLECGCDNTDSTHSHKIIYHQTPRVRKRKGGSRWEDLKLYNLYPSEVNWLRYEIHEY